VRRPERSYQLAKLRKRQAVHRLAGSLSIIREEQLFWNYLKKTSEVIFGVFGIGR
jgi:hypothetical protein